MKINFVVIWNVKTFKKLQITNTYQSLRTNYAKLCNHRTRRLLRLLSPESVYVAMNLQSPNSLGFTKNLPTCSLRG